MKRMHRLNAAVVFFLLGLVSTSPALAQTTWTGGSPATWSVGSFWLGGVPTASTAVVMSGTGTMNIVNGVIASATSINFAASSGQATLFINDGGRLNVGGVITKSGAQTADIRVYNTNSANASSILTATSITASSVLFGNTTGAQFLTMSSDVTLATQLAIGSATGTATYRQTGGTLTTQHTGYGITLTNVNSYSTSGTASFILDGGRVISDRIGVGNLDGNNGGTAKYAGWASFMFNSGTIQTGQSGATYFQNGRARTSSTTADTQYDTSRPVTIALADTGTHEFNATVGNIYVTPSAQVRDQAGVAGTLLKTGTGSLIFTGDGPVAVNDWTGASTVSAGALSVDYNQIAGTATSGSTTALSNAYSPASQLVLNGGNFTLTGRPNALATSLTNVSMAANQFNATVASTTGLVIGQAVTNANLPAGTYIRRIISGTTIELNALSGTTALSGETFTVASANFTNSQTINSVSLQQSGTVTVNPAGDSTVLTFGTVSGAAGFTKAGTALLVLSGSNTFSGGATLSAGTLALNHASALGTGTFTISGGTIDNTSASVIVNCQNNAQNWNGDFSFTGTKDLDLGTGAVTLSANRQVTTTAGVLTVGGAIGGAYSLTKAGVGTMLLSGSNGYTGSTAVTAGTLDFSTVNALRNTSGVSITGGAALRYSGMAATFDRNVSVTSGTGTVSNSGGGLLTLSGTLTKNGTVLRLTGGSFNVTGQIVGASSKSDLLVDGTSTVTLSSANTYNGPTFVNQASNLIVGVANAIPSNSIVTLGNATTTGTLTLGSNSNAIGGLAFGAGGGTLRLAASATGATAQLTATSGTMTLTNGSLDLAGSGTSAGYYRLLSAQSIAGSFSSITGTNGAYQVLTTATSVDYQQRAVLGAVAVTNPAVSIITGGSAAFTYSVANAALSGGASLAVTGTGLSNVIGTSGGTAAAGGSTGPLSGLVFTGTGIGANQQGTFTVNAADVFGTTTSTGTVAVTVLDHATSSLASGSTAVLNTVLDLGTWDYSKLAWTSGTNSALFSIYNLASSYGAGLTADLSLASVSGTGNGFTTNLGSYTDIGGGQSRQYSVSVDPTGFLTSGSQSWTFTIGMRDKTGVAGATSTSTLLVTANVIVVPEPTAFWLGVGGAGLGGWVAWRRRRPSAGCR